MTKIPLSWYIHKIYSDEDLLIMYSRLRHTEKVVVILESALSQPYPDRAIAMKLFYHRTTDPNKIHYMDTLLET